jgi:hypothetical protein
MRGYMLRALPVCFVAFAAGCFTFPGNLGNFGTPAVPRTATHAYWQGASTALSQKPSGDMRELVQFVRTQTNALRELSPDGVDPALVAAVEDVIKCEEEVIRIAEMAGNDPTVLRTSQAMTQMFGDANRKAAESKKRLKALRGPLNDRHGGGFAPMG